mgnify:CR=1 FL=1
MNKLKPMVVMSSDLYINVKASLGSGLFEIIYKNDFDIIIGSEAFHYAFANIWGIGSIGVGAKFLIKSKKEVWRWYKISATLNNTEFYLKSKYLFTKNNFNFLRSRLEGGFNQLRYKWKRMDI